MYHPTMNTASLTTQPTPPLIDGASRVHFIVGDPIAQVKSPAGLSQAFQEAGWNAVCIPAHVAPADLAAWLRGVSLAKNVDGIIVTVPHKFACFDLCATTSDRGAFLRSINTLRRNPDGTWHGDMFDGLGYVKALQLKGCELIGKKALLVGAGGAGSAIAHSLATAGLRSLAIHDADSARRDALIHRLTALDACQVVAGSRDPSGYDVAINATPVGMQDGDPHPIESSLFTPELFVGCVITAPAVPPMIAAARSLGCNTLTGAEMFAQVKDLMVDFLLRK